MNEPDTAEQFVRRLTESQNRIYGYVFSLLGDHSRAADVVQETNVTLWRKINEFDSGRPFLPWAFAVARFQVMAHLRDNQRDRLLLDAELAETISQEIEPQATQLDNLRESLRPCLQRLSPEHRQLITHRYFKAMSLDSIAAEAGRTTGAIKVALLRIRRQLADCMQQQQRAEG